MFGDKYLRITDKCSIFVEELGKFSIEVQKFEGFQAL